MCFHSKSNLKGHSLLTIVDTGKTKPNGRHTLGRVSRKKSRRSQELAFKKSTLISWEGGHAEGYSNNSHRTQVRPPHGAGCLVLTREARCHFKDFCCCVSRAVCKLRPSDPRLCKEPDTQNMVRLWKRNPNQIYTASQPKL